MYRYVKNCRCCGSDDLVNYLDLGDQPLANSYHKGEAVPSAPLEVDFCRACSHSQLSVVVDPEVMFKNYLYVSSTTQTFRHHCSELAESALGFRNAKGTPRVLDIACNDGCLLERFSELGAEVWGVDPAENLREVTKAKMIPVHVGFWSEESRNALAALSGVPEGFETPLFDVITGTNVFAHVDNVTDFLTQAQRALRDQDSVIVLEFPYGQDFVAKREFDTVYHEHLSYFTAASFKKLCLRVGLKVAKSEKRAVHGGTLRVFLKKDFYGQGAWCSRFLRMVEAERRNGLDREETYLAFARDVEATRESVKALVRSLRRNGEAVVGYGASAKGNTALNFWGVKLDMIVDDNPGKHGYQTPGRNIPIREPQALREFPGRNLNVIVLSWNFLDEIKRKMRNILEPDRSAYVITYVPKVNVETL